MILYGVASSRTEKVVEFFPDREQAESMIGDVHRDEPDLARLLEVIAVEFETSAN